MIGLAFAAMLALGASEPAPAAPAPVAPAATTAAVAPTPVAKLDPMDQVVCVREESTGSRVDTHKECHTRRDWKLMSDDGRDFLNDRTLSRNTAAGGK